MNEAIKGIRRGGAAEGRYTPGWLCIMNDLDAGQVLELGSYLSAGRGISSSAPLKKKKESLLRFRWA